MKTEVNVTAKKKRKKKIILIVLAALILLAIVGFALWFFLDKNVGKNGKMQGFGAGSFSGRGGSTSTINLQGYVTASGVTNVGTVSETFDVTELDTELRIEAVYVASGDELKAGDKLLKLTEESVSEARKELQDKERDTELSYRTGVVEYERSKIAAAYDRDGTKLEGTQADAVYQDSLLDMAQDVETAQAKLDDAKEQIQEYKAYVDGDAYREYFKVDEYQKLYDENLKLLTDQMEKWGIEWSQVTSGGGSSGAGTGGSTPGGTGGFSGGGEMPDGSFSKDTDEYSQWVSILRNLYSVLEQNKKDLDNAQEQYEEALQTASLEKKLLELSLPELEENLAQAKASYEKAVLQNELTKEKSIANADRADHDYETALEKAESDYEVLESAWKDAKKNLEIFEEQVGDGYFYASSDGKVLRSSVRANSSLRAGGTVITYSDLTAMTVTVSVDQSDVAKIKPGDTALVMSQQGAMMDGVVKSVNPVSNSESRNNVTYGVTVELDGAGQLGSNESVTVVFGMTTVDISGMGNGSTSDGSGGEQPGGKSGWGNGERPEGMPSWGDGEMPSFGDGEMPNFGGGERPEGRPNERNGKGEEE